MMNRVALVVADFDFDGPHYLAKLPSRLYQIPFCPSRPVQTVECGMTKNIVKSTQVRNHQSHPVF